MLEDLLFHDSSAFSEDPQSLLCIHCEDDMIKNVYRPVCKPQLDLSILLAHATLDWGIKMGMVILGYCFQESVNI